MVATVPFIVSGKAGNSSIFNCENLTAQTAEQVPTIKEFMAKQIGIGVIRINIRTDIHPKNLYLTAQYNNGETTKVEFGHYPNQFIKSFFYATAKEGEDAIFVNSDLKDLIITSPQDFNMVMFPSSQQKGVVQIA